MGGSPAEPVPLHRPVGPDKEAYGFHRGSSSPGFADGRVVRFQKGLDNRVYVRLVGMQDGMAVPQDY